MRSRPLQLEIFLDFSISGTRWCRLVLARVAQFGSKTGSRARARHVQGNCSISIGRRLRYRRSDRRAAARTLRDDKPMEGQEEAASALRRRRGVMFSRCPTYCPALSSGGCSEED